jgi:hypothetical protein
VIEFEFYHPLASVAAISVARGPGAFTTIIVPVYLGTIDAGARLAWLQASMGTGRVAIWNGHLKMAD